MSQPLISPNIMKPLLILFLLLLPVPMLLAQGSQEIALKGATEVHFSADLSGLIIKASASASTIQLNHVLEINGEDRPDLRDLAVTRNGNSIEITERKPTAELLNSVTKGNSVTITHNDDANWDWGGGRMKVKAYLEVTVPADLSITAETLYGGIEASGVRLMPAAESTYGTVEVVFASDCVISNLNYKSEYQSVDVALPADIMADITLTTDYGNMYSDFDYRVPASRNGLKRDGKLIGTINGGGIPVSLTATYQNIYLRKL